MGIQGGTSEASKAFQRAERRVKELQFQQDEDKKNQERMTELAQKLQQKIRTYKQEIEEIAALNLAKFRKAQQEFEETEERQKMCEVQMSNVRSERAGSFF